jgi:hypothetical protein
MSIQLTLEELCFCDIKWPIKITVYSYFKGMNAPIGELETTVANLIDHVAIKGNADRDRALKLQKVSEQRDYENIRGYIVILNAKIIPLLAKGNASSTGNETVTVSREKTVQHSSTPPPVTNTTSGDIETVYGSTGTTTMPLSMQPSVPATSLSITQPYIVPDLSELPTMPNPADMERLGSC